MLPATPAPETAPLLISIAPEFPVTAFPVCIVIDPED